MPLREGVGELTHEEYMIGPGAIYLNWQSAAEPGTCLGETKGGNIFEVLPTFHEYEPDGAMGHIKNHTVIASVIMRLTANLSGVTLDNLKRMLPGSESSDYDIVHIESEYGTVGTGDSDTDTFTPLGGAAIIFSSLKVYSDPGDAAPTLLTKDTDYSVNETTGAIIEIDDGFEEDDKILVTYDYGATIVHVEADWGMVGTGEDTDSFTPFGEGEIIFSTLKVYEDDGTDIPTLLTLTTDYTVAEDTGVITAAAGGFTLDSNVLVTYDYDAGETTATTSIITLDKIVSGDYLTNIAIVGEISDPLKTLDAVLVVENALNMNGLTLALPGGSREAVVMPAIFEGHWDPADPLTLDYAPFKIYYDLA